MFPDEMRFKFLGYISDVWDYDNKEETMFLKIPQKTQNEILTL